MMVNWLRGIEEVTPPLQPSFRSARLDGEVMGCHHRVLIWKGLVWLIYNGQEGVETPT